LSRFAGVSEAVRPKRESAGEILSERSESKDLLWLGVSSQFKCRRLN
jgi:hypothetical protein